ncbi:MAG: type II secretion system protein GspG [Kiritimatiellaeota bacterium]|nr:type II secretion system protein GspG [Kiritimatiellota bacterium]
MRYRCPYCKTLVEDDPQPHCPSCGKMMVVPKMREHSQRALRRRTIERIWKEAEQKKEALQIIIQPSMFKNKRFYIGLVFVLGLIGLWLLSTTDEAVERKRNSTSPQLRTLRNLDVLAEALGRYRFHTGAYPSAALGLAALVRDPGADQAPGWNGPYISHLLSDIWDTPYVYAPPTKEGELPTLFSCGPDRQPGTPDDLKPDPGRFDPGTEWTNGWRRAEDRIYPGVRILPD